MKGWTSKYYDHFDLPTIDATDPVVVKYIFHCKMYVFFFLSLNFHSGIGFVLSQGNWIRLFAVCRSLDTSLGLHSSFFSLRKAHLF